MLSITESRIQIECNQLDQHCLGSTKPGLWTLDWTVEWTLDSIMESIFGLEF